MNNSEVGPGGWKEKGWQRGGLKYRLECGTGLSRMGRNGMEKWERTRRFELVDDAKNGEKIS